MTMEFGWINAAGGLIVALMLVPNVVYALRCPGQENRCKNRIMNLLEQMGRYASMALMVLPVGVWEFGFPNVGAMLVYLIGNFVLLLGYWVSWGGYFRRPGRGLSRALVMLPTCIFILSGITLRHWLLAAAGAVFGIAHGYVTAANNRK